LKNNPITEKPLKKTNTNYSSFCTNPFNFFKNRCFYLAISNYYALYIYIYIYIIFQNLFFYPVLFWNTEARGEWRWGGRDFVFLTIVMSSIKRTYEEGTRRCSSNCKRNKYFKKTNNKRQIQYLDPRNLNAVSRVYTQYFKCLILYLFFIFFLKDTYTIIIF
jgi:hypothetical protein